MVLVFGWRKENKHTPHQILCSHSPPPHKRLAGFQCQNLCTKISSHNRNQLQQSSISNFRERKKNNKRGEHGKQCQWLLQWSSPVFSRVFLPIIPRAANPELFTLLCAHTAVVQCQNTALCRFFSPSLKQQLVKLIINITLFGRKGRKCI